MRIVGIIPARYDSTRFPGKPLANILGKSMIQRVYEQCKKCSNLDEVVIATENKKILEHIEGFYGNAVMTSNKHKSGTERCNEALKYLNAEYDIIINIQGDEPYINPKQIDELIDLFSISDTKIATLAKPITSQQEIKDINTPKVFLDNKTGIATNFCRDMTNKISKTSYFKHIGIYGYKKDVLSKICKLPLSEREKKEELEQLRWLDNGYKIKVGITTFETLSVDTPNDIKRIEEKMI